MYAIKLDMRKLLINANLRIASFTDISTCFASFEHYLQCFSSYELMKKCWEHEQENRPSFHDVHEQLKEMLGETDHVRKLL